MSRFYEGHLFYGLGPKLTFEQQHYLNEIDDKQIVLANCKAGTGKTTVAVAAAKYYVESNSKIDGLVYLFNPTEEDEMGFRPGDQGTKESAYLRPLYSALAEVGEQPEAVNRQGGWIVGESHTFYRGDNVQNKFVIIDEAQNWTKPKLKKALTRFHDSCKVVVIGHTGQCDLPNPSLSGFIYALDHFSKVPDRAGIVELSKNFRGWLSNYSDAM
jgi:phosphate starvation-inducible protein PhoH and related proteins